jgi:hypothetical protein
MIRRLQEISQASIKIQDGVNGAAVITGTKDQVYRGVHLVNCAVSHSIKFQLAIVIFDPTFEGVIVLETRELIALQRRGEKLIRTVEDSTAKCLASHHLADKVNFLGIASIADRVTQDFVVEADVIVICSWKDDGEQQQQQQQQQQSPPLISGTNAPFFVPLSAALAYRLQDPSSQRNSPEKQHMISFLKRASEGTERRRGLLPHRDRLSPFPFVTVTGSMDDPKQVTLDAVVFCVITRTTPENVLEVLLVIERTDLVDRT